MDIHSFYTKTLDYLNNLKNANLSEELFKNFTILLSGISEYATQAFNESEKIDYFCSAVSLYTANKILFLNEIENNIAETNPKSIVNYINTSEYVRLGFNKANGSNEDKEKLKNAFEELQSPLLRKFFINLEIYNKIKIENSENKYSEKTFNLVKKAAALLENELESEDDLDIFIESLYNNHELPKSFCKIIIPLRQFIKLFKNENLFYSKISNTLLGEKLKGMNIQSPVKTDLYYENSIMYLKLLNNFGLISYSILGGLFYIIINENNSDDVKSELSFRYAKNVLLSFPDFFLKYPGFAFYLYDEIKKFDLNTFARAFDCISNISYEEIKLYENAKVYEGQEVPYLHQIFKSDIFNQKEEDLKYEKNVNQNIICTLLFIGLMDFISSQEKDTPDEIVLMLNLLKQKKINQFSYLVPILNKLSNKMGFSKNKPFCELSFDENDTSEFSAKNVSVNILYMLTHVDSLDAIYHEISYVREHQRAVLDCVPNKKFRYDKEDVQNVIDTLIKNKKILKGIDVGFSINFFQEHELSKMLGIKKGVTRNITFKMFCETDKRFYNMHSYENDGKYKIDYEEDYRVTYRNRFSKYYLYMDRNRYMHYSEDINIEKLFDDSCSLTNLFTAIDETGIFLAKAKKNAADKESEALYTYYLMMMGGPFYKILCKFAPEETLPIAEYQNIIDTLFYKKMDKRRNTEIRILNKKYRQRASDFSIEQNISKTDLDLLKKGFEFAFIIDNDFLSICKEKVIVYLMYISITLSKIK